MKVVIGCDKNAFELKNAIIDHLSENEIKTKDIGVFTKEDETYYPNIAEQAANIILDEENDIEFGILICGTGIGMSIAANKFKGIKSAVCHDIYSAERAKKSNNTNIMTMGAQVIGLKVAKKMVDAWVSSNYIGGRSTQKVELIKKFESENFK